MATSLRYAGRWFVCAAVGALCTYAPVQALYELDLLQNDAPGADGFSETDGINPQSPATSTEEPAAESGGAVTEDRPATTDEKTETDQGRAEPEADAPPSSQDEPAPKPDLVQVNGQGRIELRVADMPLATVLRMLSIKARRNIIASPAVQGTVTADLYQVTFDEALRAILITNGCDYEVRDGLIYVYTVAELSPLTHRYFPLDYIAASEVRSVVEPLLSDRGKIVASIGTEAGIVADAKYVQSDARAGADFVVVYDYPDRFPEIAAIIEEVDVKPMQVLVEATILRVGLNENNALGIDFTTVGGIDFNMLQSTSPAAQSITTGNTPQLMLDDTTFSVRTNFNASVPAGGFSFGIIKDQIGVFIRALEQITDAEILANPKVLALNKQVGNVIVGRRDGYLTTTVTETSAIQEVEFLETGTQLTFRPFISKDGYVRMELHPEDSVGGLTPAQLPFEQTTEVTTNVLVRDGHTILIGGLFREVSNDTRSQMPLLGDIPLLGNLFRSRGDSIQREEVVILLTVHIVKDEADYVRYSMEQLEDIERTRVGVRRGMMWHGRERLAQAHYRKAIEFHAEGDTERALWNVRMALHNQPRFLTAIKLKEDIEQAREWDDEGSITRNFIRSLILNERDDESPPFGRPAPPFKGAETPDAPKGE